MCFLITQLSHNKTKKNKRAVFQPECYRSFAKQSIKNVELKIDSGDASVQVLSITGDEVVWGNNYQEDSSFTIDLYDVKANGEYLLKIETTQSKKASLIITSDNKLVKDNEEPEKYIIEKK